MAAYRRRSDGILEIVRPPPTSKVRSAISTLAAALCVALVPAVALAVYVSLGLPLVLVAVVAVAVAFAWMAFRGRGRAPAQVAPRRLASTGPAARSEPVDARLP